MTGRAWPRVLRLSNAPTAVADILMGAAVARGADFADRSTLLMALASLGLYHGGMALNDAVDAPVDTEQNRDRPIAKGKLRRGVVFRAAWLLLIAGVGLAAYASAETQTPAPVAIATAIAVGVVLYNTKLKRTFAGPLLMGACRALNVLLGASAALTTGVALQLAPGVMAYVAGLTWFARDEALGGRRGQLLAGMSVSVLGVLWLAVAPWITTVGRWPLAEAPVWTLLWLVTACYVFRGAVAALLQPTPARVGRAVGIGIQGIVLIDASLATGYAGSHAGLTVLVCLPLAMLLARWIPPT